MKPPLQPRRGIPDPKPTVAARPFRAAVPPPVFRPVVQARRAPAPAQVQAAPPRPVTPAPAPRPTVAPPRSPGAVVQSFWLEHNKQTTWQTGTPDRTRYRDSGRTEWESWWKPALWNRKLPVYEPIPAVKAAITPVAVKTRQATRVPKVKATSSSPSSDRAPYLAAARKAGGAREWENWNGYKKQLRLPPGLENKKFLEKLEDAYRKGMENNPIIKPEPGRTYAPGRKPKQASILTPQERHANKVALTVDSLLAALDGAVGKYPLYDKSDTSPQAVRREGCVKYGPDFPVDADLQQEVYDAMQALEGTVRAGGRLHVVDKSPPGTYDVTLHGNYKAFNPLTTVILHVT